MPLYGEIIREFYNIGLSDGDARLVSEHFSGAVHHHAHAAAARNAFVARWHDLRWRAHIRQLCLVIFERGDFTQADDPTDQGKDEREFWNPDFQAIPTTDMLVGEHLGPDPSVPPLVAHPLDGLLKDLRGPTELPRFVRRRCS